jgi:Leucine-rich repeat (LRR) protein
LDEFSWLTTFRIAAHRFILDLFHLSFLCRILVGCSFSGEIPKELGQLSKLIFLSLNSNKFSGSIPASLGNLSKLYWFDLADNKLTGELPIFDGTNPGLDNLTNTKHFHFGINQLSGPIPSQIFSSHMKLIHL